MRSSASEAASTMTNGVTWRASPSCLPIAGAGTVSSCNVLTMNISVWRGFKTGRWQRKGLLEKGQVGREKKKCLWFSALSTETGLWGFLVTAGQRWELCTCSGKGKHGLCQTSAMCCGSTVLNYFLSNSQLIKCRLENHKENLQIGLPLSLETSAILKWNMAKIIDK